ncbi:MAG: hypothetical protein ACI8ZW_000195 [Yoonia sp.]|jgi:hypothetical protein
MIQLNVIVSLLGARLPEQGTLRLPVKQPVLKKVLDAEQCCGSAVAFAQSFGYFLYLFCAEAGLESTRIGPINGPVGSIALIFGEPLRPNSWLNNTGIMNNFELTIRLCNFIDHWLHIFIAEWDINFA